MPEFSVILERFGGPPLLAALGLGFGLLFGFMAQRSRFCLRAAVIEFARRRPGEKLAVWLLAFAVAFGTMQALILAGLFSAAEARQIAARGSFSGAVLGGLLFGSGMILARGCASRLLVLSATGNLRALLTGLVFAVAAQASWQGLLAPAREALSALWIVEGGPQRDLAAFLGLGLEGRLIVAGLWLAAALVFAVRGRVGAWAWIGGIGTGLSVAGAWAVTYAVAQVSFEPAPIGGITFSGPSAKLLMLVLAPSGRMVDFEIGLVPGVFAGSLIAALLFREWRLQGFHDGHSMRRYLAGAGLMGFGAMLAGGCAVGAGVTGGVIFAATAWLALGGMWVGAAVTDWLVDQPPTGVALADTNPLHLVEASGKAA
jgi:uncharacterized membrane protein YedE/YeeE